MRLPHRLAILAQTVWLRWLLVAALVIMYGGWTGYVIARDKPLDFYVYYIAAAAFLRGQDAYEISDRAWDNLAAELQITNYAKPYRYPPLTAELVAPLTLLPSKVAATCWLVLSTVAAVAAACWLALSSETRYRWPLALGGTLFFVPVLTTLHAGQVNLFLLASLALALWAFSRDKPLWVGGALAMGAHLKLIPLALAGHLLWRRQWRAVLVATMTLILLCLLALPLVGWSGLVSYARHSIWLTEPDQVFVAPPNQSLTGFFGRLLGSQDGGNSVRNTHLALALGRASAVVLILATIAVCWPTGDARRYFQLEFALIVAALQLVSPFTWYHQFVLLLIPFVVLANEALQVPGLRWMLIPLALGYLLTDLHGLLWHHLTGLTLLQSAPLYTALMLWGMLAWLVVRRKRRAGA